LSDAERNELVASGVTSVRITDTSAQARDLLDLAALFGDAELDATSVLVTQLTGDLGDALTGSVDDIRAVFGHPRIEVSDDVDPDAPSLDVVDVGGVSTPDLDTVPTFTVDPEKGAVATVVMKGSNYLAAESLEAEALSEVEYWEAMPFILGDVKIAAVPAVLYNDADVTAAAQIAGIVSGGVKTQAVEAVLYNDADVTTAAQIAGVVSGGVKTQAVEAVLYTNADVTSYIAASPVQLLSTSLSDAEQMVRDAQLMMSEATVSIPLTGNGLPMPVTLTQELVSALGDGNVVVTATQVDAAGNKQLVAASTTSFVIDTLSPAVADAAGSGVTVEVAPQNW